MNEKLKGDALVNKVALIIIEIINTALILGYISDYLTGTSTLGYFVTFEAAALATFIILPIVYKKQPDKLKYVAFICFTIEYLIGILGAHLDLAFVMAFPVIIVFVLYYDYALMRNMAITIGSIIVIDCAYIIFINKKQHSGLPINSSMLLMEFLATIIFLAAGTVVTKISNQNNEEKLAAIQTVADKVNSSIKEINVELGSLNESSNSVRIAMDEINTGINSTAIAVQNQLIQTEAIQDRIENVGQAAGKISKNVATTLEAVDRGNTDVNELVSRADESVVISEQVTADLDILKTNIGNMRNITKLIDNIAFKTNIMALNANVEAAHAGDAGKGFAVVATEISNMSNQTKDATDEITDLINNAVKSLSNLDASINQMNEIIVAEQEKTSETSEIFTSILGSTEEVSSNVNLFMEYIKGLTDANREIVQSVQTISATTEEVTVLTDEARIREHSNAEAVDSIAKQVELLAQE